jgi:hypothetical protein
MDRLNTAQEPETLKTNISYLLHWKDGKVRQDPNGEVMIDDFHYTLSPPKPNIYSETKHASTLASQEFFQWAKLVRNLAVFSPAYVLEICNKFDLWSINVIVLPTYLLHILNPRVFPIFDQHVNRARKFLMSQDFDIYRRTTDIDDYRKYVAFWKELTESLNINLMQVDRAEIKKVDNALWAMGKFISRHIILGKPYKVKKQVAKPRKEAGIGDLADILINHTTNSPEFKNRVLGYCQNMHQVDAIKRAATELSIPLCQDSCRLSVRDLC